MTINDEIIQEFREFATSQAENLRYYLRHGKADTAKVRLGDEYYSSFQRRTAKFHRELSDKWDKVFSAARREVEDLDVIDKVIADKYIWLSVRQANLWSLLIGGETYLAYDDGEDMMLVQIDQSLFKPKWEEAIEYTKTRLISNLFVHIERIIDEVQYQPSTEQSGYEE